MPARELRSAIAERRDAEHGGLREQLLAGLSAAQEREMRGDLQFGIVGL